MFATKISLYGIFIMFSIFMGLFVVYKNTIYLNFRREETIGLLIYIAIGAIFGAKYFTFLINFGNYAGTFDFVKVGLSSYGAVIGIIILLFLFSKQYKKSFRDLIYVLLPSIPLMYSIGKIGCFLAGCCYGIEYNGPLSVSYNYSYDAIKGVSLFPVQLLETIVFFVIFIYINNKIRNKKTDKIIVIGQTFVISGVAKFLLDYLRMNNTDGLFSINQLISIIFAFIGIIMIFIGMRRSMCKRVQ